MSDISRRFGRFMMPHDLIYNDDARDFLREIFANVIVTRAESIYHEYSISYVALSELFDIVPVGATIPAYDVNYDKDTKLVTATKLGGESL